MEIMPYNSSMSAPEGFRVTTVGTGAPHFDPKRASACTLIQYKDTSIMVDMGYGSVGRMASAGLDVFHIPNILFSHCLHFDHTLDYAYYMCISWHNGLPLNLYGPPGTVKLHNVIYDLFEDQLNLFDKDRPKDLNIRELADGDTFSIGPVSVEVREVPHVVQNYAYRFAAGGQSVVVTGDMCFCEHFIPFAKGADLIVFDANTAPSGFMTQVMEQQRKAGKMPGKMQRPGGNAHAELEEIADMAERAGAKAIVLTHFTRDPDLEAAKDRISGAYHGQILMGEDMLAITL